MVKTPGSLPSFFKDSQKKQAAGGGLNMYPWPRIQSNSQLKI